METELTKLFCMAAKITPLNNLQGLLSRHANEIIADRFLDYADDAWYRFEKSGELVANALLTVAINNDNWDFCRTILTHHSCDVGTALFGKAQFRNAPDDVMNLLVSNGNNSISVQRIMGY